MKNEESSSNVGSTPIVMFPAVHRNPREPPLPISLCSLIREVVFLQTQPIVSRASLDIKWRGEEHLYDVNFEVQGRDMRSLNSSLMDQAMNRVPKESRCICGSPLRLGDLSVRTQLTEFVLQAEYYCPTCRQKRIRKGRISRALARLVAPLKKIEVGPGGIKIEK